MENALKKYDVILVDFGNDTVGCEQYGIRPAVIVQNNIGNNHSSTTLAMPLTKKIKHPWQPTHTIIRAGGRNGLDEDSMVMGEALRQISEKRIISYLGTITDQNERSEIRRIYQANFGE